MGQGPRAAGDAFRKWSVFKENKSGPGHTAHWTCAVRSNATRAARGEAEGPGRWRSGPCTALVLRPSSGLAQGRALHTGSGCGIRGKWGQGTPRNSQREGARFPGGLRGTWMGDTITGHYGGTGQLCARVAPLSGRGPRSHQLVLIPVIKPPSHVTSGHSPGVCRGQEAAVCPSIQVCSVNPRPPVRTRQVG